MTTFLLLLITLMSSSSLFQRTTTTTEAYTIVVGLNPAFQKQFLLDASSNPNLTPGSVHRASSIKEGIGGKGQDVAVTLTCLSQSNSAVKMAQFLGKGAEGDTVQSLLLQLDPSMDMSLTVRSSAKLRTCTTIVGKDLATELVEPSGRILKEEVEELCDAVGSFVGADGDDAAAALGGVCIMGSMPPGCDDDMYASLYRQIVDNCANNLDAGKICCLVDSVVGLGPLLTQMADDKCVGKTSNMLKVNIAELCKLTSTTKSSGGEADQASIEEITNAIDGLHKTFPSARKALDYLAITDGKYPAHLVRISDGTRGEDILYKLNVADLMQYKKDKSHLNDDAVDYETGTTTLYPIGAGDTVAGGTLAAWQYLVHGEDKSSMANTLNKKVQTALSSMSQRNDGGETSSDPVVTAFAFGLACGSASCLQEDNSVLDVDDALGLFGQFGPPQIVTSSKQMDEVIS